MVEAFETLADGRIVYALTLQGPKLKARILSLGAVVQDLRLHGTDHPLVLGFEHAHQYLAPTGLYTGAIVGRMANRIGGAMVTIDGHSYRLAPNFLGRHQLHGGADGAHMQLWRIVPLAPDRAALYLDLPDGHMGYPGHLRLRVEVAVKDNALSFRFHATSDRPTFCNFAQHSYFNLAGGGDITDHKLEVMADHYLPLDPQMIPTGEIASVTGTEFDYRTAKRLFAPDIDHNLCLSTARAACRAVARLSSPHGLEMVVETTEPGLQVYDGRHFNGVRGLGGRVYGPHAGIALEAQGWPDAPNHPNFPSTLLVPGEVYESETRYRFHK